jgi:hypothetical protein
MPACDERFGSNELAERLSESAERVLAGRIHQIRIQGDCPAASQGVGMLAGPELRSRAFELSKESPRVANFYVAFGTFVGI